MLTNFRDHLIQSKWDRGLNKLSNFMVQIESWRFLTLGDTWKSDSFEKRRKLTMYSICGIYFCKNNICIHLRNKYFFLETYSVRGWGRAKRPVQNRLSGRPTCLGLILEFLQSRKSPIFKQQINYIQAQHLNFVLTLDPKVLRLGGSFFGI